MAQKYAKSIYCLFIWVMCLCSIPIALHAGCDDSASSCGKLKKSCHKAKTGCVTIPQRTQTYFTGAESCVFQEETVPEAQIFFRKQGKCCKDKPAVVFIHGFGETSDIWLCAQSELSKCFCTVSMDLRGFGRSSKTPAAPQPNGIHYTTDLFVEDIFELLNSLGIRENIILVGHSLGSNYALKYASEHQDQLLKLVLVGAAPLIVPNCAVTPTCSTSCFNPFLCQTGFCDPFGITIDDATFLTQPLVNCLNGGGQEQACLQVWGEFIAPIWYNEPCQDQLASAQAALVSAVASTPVAIINNVFFNSLTEDFRPWLSSITIPTLICFGNIDLAVDPGNSLFIHENMPNSVLAEFVGKGHQLHVTDYKNFDSLLKKFIKSSQLPDVIKVLDNGCCVCPLIKPVDYAKEECPE